MLKFYSVCIACFVFEAMSGDKYAGMVNKDGELLFDPIKVEDIYFPYCYLYSEYGLIIMNYVIIDKDGNKYSFEDDIGFIPKDVNIKDNRDEIGDGYKLLSHGTGIVLQSLDNSFTLQSINIPDNVKVIE